MGQAAHVYDGIVHDVYGFPEDEERKRLVLERCGELPERAIVQFVEDGAADGIKPPPIVFINWPGLDRAEVRFDTRIVRTQM
eukprot:13085023-Alexandrium_andersonii.AAC.1